MKIIISGTILLTMLGVIAGCESGPKPEPKMAPASRAVPEVEQAANDLASAYCERSQRCNEVGPNSKYTSMEECQQARLVETREALGECNKGIDRGDFDQCVATVREEGCGDPLDAMHQYKACGSDDLCND